MANQPHFVLVPLMTHGHMIPMVDLALLLADHGAIVSFITTPVNAARIQPTIQHVGQSRLPVNFIPLPFPATAVGLPAGCESMDLIPSGYSYKSFYTATTLLAKPLSLYLQQHTHHGPTVIIHDHCHPWVMSVASRLAIPRLTFTGTSAIYLLHTRRIGAPTFFSAPGWEDARDAALEAEATAEGMLINTFDELESGSIEELRKSSGKKVWAIGPLSIRKKDDDNNSVRGKQAVIDEELVSSWLDTMQPRSVVYVSFGTMARTSSAQLREIALGLEAASRPFIWVVEKSTKLESWMAGFEGRTKGTGMVIKGWAPQVMILSHPAVGGFVTHCGWNSTLEAVAAGVPMVTWPRNTDQFLNERLVVEVLGVGVVVGDYNGMVVKKEEVAKAVAKLMEGGKEGEERRQRSRDLGEKARKAMEGGGSTSRNLSGLIQYFSEYENKMF